MSEWVVQYALDNGLRPTRNPHRAATLTKERCTVRWTNGSALVYIMTKPHCDGVFVDVKWWDEIIKNNHRGNGPAKLMFYASASHVARVITSHAPDIFDTVQNAQREWIQNGQLHRLDGPAHEGGMDHNWYVNGICVPGWHKNMSVEDVGDILYRERHDLMRVKGIKILARHMGITEDTIKALELMGTFA